MKIDEIRERYLKFFEKRGHTIYPSDSLVPENDPSLLFTGAGMNQFKDMFLGKGKLPFKRATTAQKCMRTGDIEKVGRTSSHHTFFEMMGNFSFGDYFKEDTIMWAWEFLTKEMKLSEELLYVSVYKDDEEAYKIWSEKVGLPSHKIYKFGEADNFWPANAPSQGPNGPCGPCSEIFYDFGSKYSCGSPTCKAGCDCNRYVEIWNLVFTQFDRQEGGTLAPLPQKNIDTGMGLERMGAVMQGVHSNFDTDMFAPLIRAIGDTISIKYNSEAEEGAKIRRIADHIRAVVFCISDGVLPSNEGRGYVERKILRIAIRDALSMNCKKSFLYKIVPVVADVMKKQYPDVYKRRDNIANIVKAEEEKFIQTVEQGSIILESDIKKLKASGKNILSGEKAFMLYDTYGFPIEMTESILHESGLRVDRVGFERSLEQQRQQARQQTKIATDIFGGGPILDIKSRFKPTEFLGYETTKADVTILAMIKGNELVDSASRGDEISILADKTPFYGEAGGQIGDAGVFISKDKDVKIEVSDTTKPDGYFLHHSKVVKGIVRVGQRLIAKVDRERRKNIMRNHTATHLLQSALRNILGKHVEQAGSLVADDRLRFDFTHFAPMSEKEIEDVEAFVNNAITKDIIVSKKVMPIEEAKKHSALMLFGEKYGDIVRVVSVKNVSTELCSGTHLNKTGTIGCFKILSERSIGSGIRRIEAVTCAAVKQALETEQRKIEEENKKLLEEIKMLKQQGARGKKESSDEIVEELIKSPKWTEGRKYAYISNEVEGQKTIDELLSLCDKVIEKALMATFLVSTNNNRANFVMKLNRKFSVVSVAKANELAKEIGKVCDGGGGGNEFTAQGGINPSKKTLAFQIFDNAMNKAP